MGFLQWCRVLGSNVLCVCVGVFQEFAWNSVWMMLEVAFAENYMWTDMLVIYTNHGVFILMALCCRRKVLFNKENIVWLDPMLINRMLGVDGLKKK